MDKNKELLLDNLCMKEFCNEDFTKLINIQAECSYYTGRVELFYILPSTIKVKAKYKEHLLNYGVPKTIAQKKHNGRINSFNVNFKLLLLEILLFYNIMFEDLDQQKINKLYDILPYHNFNQLQKILYEYDKNKYDKPKTAKIKLEDNHLEKINKLINLFIFDEILKNKMSDASSFTSQLKRFLLFLSTKPYIDTVSDITRSDIEDYIKYLKSTDYNKLIKNKNRNSFVYRNLRAVYKFFDYLSKREDSLKKENIPLKNLIYQSDFPNSVRRESKHLSTWADNLIIKNIERMPEETKQELMEKTIMLLFYWTGVRCKDACTITRDCLSIKSDVYWLKIFSNKTRQEYEIPIVNILGEYIDKCIKMKTGKVNIHPTTGRRRRFLFWDNIKLNSFQRNIYDLVIKLGCITKYQAIKEGVPIEDVNTLNITPHKFRHNIAIKYLRLGEDALSIAEMLGHTDLSMAQSYIKEDDEFLQTLMQKILNDKDIYNNEETSIVKVNLNVPNINLIKSKKEIFETNSKIQRVNTGWCIYDGDQPYCKEDKQSCVCFNSSFDCNTQDSKEKLRVLIKDHEDLLSYNNKNKFIKEAKKEKMIIKKLNNILVGDQYEQKKNS